MAKADLPDLLAPAEAAELLEISVATLRRWAGRFEAFLDPASDPAPDAPRYSDNDLETLAHIKRWLEEGWTYDQVTEKLGSAAQSDAVTGESKAWHEAPTDAVLTDVVEDAGAAYGLQAVDALSPAARFVRDAIQGLTDTQQIILNSQQASRSLMGVMVQDNLNLKGEAASLRERMLELERELAEQRRRHADYRERMDTRVHVLEDAVARLMARGAAPVGGLSAPAQPQQSRPQAADGERRGFWARLIGG